MRLAFLMLFSFLLPIIGYAQKPSCVDFKTGYFQNIDSRDSSNFIKRTKDYQYEHEKSSGVKLKLKVTWIDECTYRLTLIKGNSKWNKAAQVKDNPDLIVEIVQTGPDYYIQVVTPASATGSVRLNISGVVSGNQSCEPLDPAKLLPNNQLH